MRSDLNGTLSFFLEAPVCYGTSFMELLIDESDPSCGVVGYNQVNIDLTTYQGQTVNLEFHSEVQGVGVGVLNFFLDDVSLDATGAPPSAATTPVPTLKWYGMGLMLLVLGFIGVRRFNQ